MESNGKGGIIAKLLKPNDRTFNPERVRLIGVTGEQLDIVPLSKARAMADQAGLDLVLVSDRATPPVVRIMDFGKLVFEQKKNLREQRKNNAAQKLKEVKFHVNVDQHDYDLKVKHAIEFLDKGCKVKITLQMRGREMAHKDLAFDLVRKVMEALVGFGDPDSEPKLMGRSITVLYSPSKKAKSAEAGRHLPPQDSQPKPAPDTAVADDEATEEKE